MDIFLLILASICMLAGLAGSFLPVLPGPPICYAGFLFLHFSAYGQFSVSFLILWAIGIIVLAVLEYLIPSWGTKKFGGTRSGKRGATAGTIIGIFIPPQPFGLIAGPFVGAYLGELMHDGRDHKKALRSAWGSFVGFMAGTLLKIIVSIVMIVVFIRELL